MVRVIEDNAITYGDERRFRDWSVGYYLNNSYFRIRSALNGLLGVNDESELRIRKTVSLDSDELQPLNIAQIMSAFDEEARPLLGWFLKLYSGYDMSEYIDTGNAIKNTKTLADALVNFLNQWQKGISDASARDIWDNAFQAANAVFTLLRHSRCM